VLSTFPKQVQIAILTDETPTSPIPALARTALAPLVAQLLDLQPRIRALEAELLAGTGRT
jgi:transposase